MILFRKETIGRSILVLGLAITGLILLALALIKAIFILSNESATQKAAILDIVLGTLSLGITIVAMIVFGLALFIIFKLKQFDRRLVALLFGVGILLIVGAALTSVRDYINYTNDWQNLNDIAKARWEIGSSLALAHTLAGDEFGNVGVLYNDGTAAGGALQNTLGIADYNNFLQQMITSKADLAALYALDELLNKAHQPLISGRILDAMAAAYQADKTHTLTVHAWFASLSADHDYDFRKVITTLKVDLTNDGELHKIINALLNQPVIYTGITSAYLQIFPISIGCLGLTALILLVTAPIIYKELGNSHSQKWQGVRVRR